ncbi:MAG: NAD(P)H-hydrate dehydratase [Lachnospiraceae bacterium]|nr:NAD(P)H-hydrate dehydratase [Lachnospiraceae bacterium]
MRYLVNAEEMRRMDANTSEKLGIPGMVLMERAALAARDHILNYIQSRGGHVGAGRLHGSYMPEVLILAGIGNNGGDGLALARLLCEQNLAVSVWCVGNEQKASEQWIRQKRILEHYQVTYCSRPKKTGYTVSVDALFGVGLSREVTGDFAEAVDLFNQLEGYKLALDLPSGISSDTGAVLGCAVKVDETITFGYEKRGLYLFPGSNYAGRVTLADIGINDRAFLGQTPGMFYIDTGDLKNLMPKRDVSGNKGTFGKVLIVAGSKGMAGAAVLAAKAAYRAGAGMVRVITDEGNRSIIQSALPEALFGNYEDLNAGIYWADALVIGPGISQSSEAAECMQKIIRTQEKPLVVDADGLNLLVRYDNLKKQLAKREGVCILTPHMGELARLVDTPVERLKVCTWDYGIRLAREMQCVVVAKDARSFVCAENKTICMNIYGNDGMATAGSGDVLTGILGGLLAQSKDTEDAYYTACLGVYLHAAAGDLVASQRGTYGCMAGDIADAVSPVMKDAWLR